MSDISKYALMIIFNSWFLVAISQINSTEHAFQQNQTNHSQSVEKSDTELTDHAILNYDFFSYDVIDHRTILVKFDLTHSILYQQSNSSYDAELYVSKIRASNYKILIGRFLGFYEKEIDGTVVDHFTFCLVLTPIVQPKKFNRNKTETIFHRYLNSSYRKQQPQASIMHYCTKMGPDEDRHRHQKKQGSEGDHVLLLLQVMMIGIFLAILQIAHISRNRKHPHWHLPSFDTFRHEHPSASPDGLGLLRFRTIDEEEIEEQEEEEEEEESLDSFHPQLPSPITKRKQSQSSSTSVEEMDENPDDSATEHLLESKPWVQIPK